MSQRFKPSTLTQEQFDLEKAKGVQTFHDGKWVLKGSTPETGFWSELKETAILQELITQIQENQDNTPTNFTRNTDGSITVSWENEQNTQIPAVAHVSTIYRGEDIVDLDALILSGNLFFIIQNTNALTSRTVTWTGATGLVSHLGVVGLIAATTSFLVPPLKTAIFELQDNVWQILVL